MKLPIRRRPRTLAVLLGCALAFVRCENETLAGSSVTTGNPTEIQVSFSGENGPVALTGRVDIYGATQIPIPGFRPEPLASIPVSGRQDVLLGTDDIASIADSLWPPGSLDGDSLARFNVVITGQGQGAILRDLALRRRAGEFVVDAASTLARKNGSQDAAKDRIARLEVGLTALTEFRVFVNPENLPPFRLNYLFLKGTGFAAREESGAFRLEALPDGEHIASFLSLPDPEQPIGGQEGDSAFVYNLNRPIIPNVQDTLTFSELDFGLILPDLYIKKN